jgi:hypothetical protein
MQRENTTWLLFAITIIISALMAFIGWMEFINVFILERTEEYPFGTEGPVSWYYKSESLYGLYNLVSGLIFSLLLSFSVWAFMKNLPRTISACLIAVVVILLLHLFTAYFV